MKGIVMSSISWKINRLKAMSVPEILWRLSQKRIQRIERKMFCDKRILVTDHVFNNDLMKFSFDADKLGINKNNTNFELGTDIRLLAGADYKKYKKKWNAGFQTINCWPNTFSYDLEYRQRDDIGDARTNWELNRHFQFAILAKDYYASNDKRYLDEFTDLFDDWNGKNPFLHGISWTSVMEVAIRCSNWCYSLAFLSYTDAPKELLNDLRSGILNMTEYVEKHYSRYSSANNHLIIEAYAIGQSGILFGKQEWIDLAIVILTKELRLQNHSDGVNKEASLHYQSFYMEAMGLMMRLLMRNGIMVPDSWSPMLDRMSRFVADCIGENGEVVEFGDNDEGKIIDLIGNWMDHYQYVLGMMSILLNEQYVSDYNCETLHWLFDESEINKTRAKEKYKSPQYCCYKEGGYTILRSKDRKVLIGIDHAELGYGSLAAHGHADALSFQLFYKGQPIFIDPGTYIYHCDIQSRNEFRKTRNHNTVCVGGKDQSEMLGAFLWGRKANSWLESIEESDEGVIVTILSDGNFPSVHRRTIEYDTDKKLVIHDAVFGQVDSMVILNIPGNLGVVGINNQIVIDGNGFNVLIDVNDFSISKSEVSHYYGIKSESSKICIRFGNEVTYRIRIRGK